MNKNNISSINIEVRPFEPADQAEARHLILTGLGEHFGYIDPSLNHDLDNIYRYYIQNGGHFIIVEEKGDRIIGTGALIHESSTSCRMVRVSVIKGKRGLGVGQRIVKHLIELGKESGFNQLVVETNHDWYSAIRMYQRCGFREFDRDEESIHLKLDI